MKRRDFLGSTALAPAMVMAATLPAEGAAAEDLAALKQLVVDYYKVYYLDLDKVKYRAMLTDDYLLLENGEVISLDGDVSLMPAPEDNYQRKDSFEFLSAQVQGDAAWLVHILKSDINDRKNGARHREFLESIILRRDGGGIWRVALLHSTKLAAA